MSAIKYSAAVRALCLRISQHGAVLDLAHEVFFYAAAAGLVVRTESGECVLTPSGNVVAVAEVEKQQCARAKRRAYSRGRSDALRSVGMVRTRAGTWE